MSEIAVFASYTAATIGIELSEKIEAVIQDAKGL
jgi:hypothetical protein